MYGYTRTKCSNWNSKVAFSLRLDGHFNRCLPELLNYGCNHRLTAHHRRNKRMRYRGYMSRVYIPISVKYVMLCTLTKVLDFYFCSTPYWDQLYFMVSNKNTSYPIQPIISINIYYFYILFNFIILETIWTLAHPKLRKPFPWKYL